MSRLACKARVRPGRWRTVVGIALFAISAPAAAQLLDPPPPEEPPVYTDADRVFYVGWWGSDSITWELNSPATPFRTLDQARQEVRRYKQAHGPQTILVRIAGGLYQLTGPVVFTAADSGWENMPIQYVAWNPDFFDNPYQDDVLFSGGIVVGGWQPAVTPFGVQAYVSQQLDVVEIRDLWVNNCRMVKARFPNVPEPCPPSMYEWPSKSPCPNQGYLIVKDVAAVPGPNGERIQRVTVRNPTGAPIPEPTNWSHVEVSATRLYVNPHQRVTSGEPIFGQPSQMHLDFLLTSWTGPAPALPQDLGALGIFYYNNWVPGATTISGQRGYLELVGEDDLQATSHPRRLVPAQLFLSNDLAFLDADKEWCFDPSTSRLWLKLACDPAASGVTVVVPVARELLILDNAEHLLFHGLDWAYTREPFPTMADGVTPGYATIQTGSIWIEGTRGLQNNPVAAAITMIGARNCVIRRGRIAHTGGSGVIIGTDDRTPGRFVESNRCVLQTCEIFDIGGHGVYIGDEYTEQDTTWSLPGFSTPTAKDPSNNIHVDTCRVENFAVTYRDLVGIYAAHTRDLYIGDTEVAYGNYDGMSIGNVQAHHFRGPYVLPTACGATRNPSQNSEGTRIVRNDIHHVMLKLTDGGGIYIQGSHIPSAQYPNDTGRLSHNYIHDIVLNPYLHNLTPHGADPHAHGNQVCKAFYFETGCDSLHLWSNYVERVQGPYSFSPNFRNRPNHGPCVASPSVVDCGGLAGWWRPSWPHDWTTTQCGPPYLMPGQRWSGYQPNSWLDVPHAAGMAPPGAYDAYDRCYGYQADAAFAGDGGMITLTGPGQPNVLVSAVGELQEAIIEAAGPRGNASVQFFKTFTDQIHRRMLCNDPASVRPEWQVQ